MDVAQVQKHPRYPTGAAVLVMTPSRQLQALSLANISLGGMFVVSTTPIDIGSRVQLRLDAGGLVVDAIGRVVHYLDESAAVHRAHAAGAGVQFERLPPYSLTNLQRYIGALADETHQTARTAMRMREEPRLNATSLATVQWPDGTREQLPLNNVSMGGLYIETELPAPVSSFVVVEIATAEGPLVLKGQVVHSVTGALSRARGMPAGAGLQFMGLDEKQRARLARYVEGRPEWKPPFAEVATGSAFSVDEVFHAAHRLLNGIDEHDGFGALGLPKGSGERQVRDATDRLRAMFAEPPAGATPPQSARIVAAARALPRLERSMLHFIEEAERAQGQQLTVLDGAAANGNAQVTDPEEVEPLLSQADEALRRGDAGEARALLQRAVEEAPSRPDARIRLEEVNRLIDRESALDLVRAAQVCVETGMRAEAARRVKEALRLCFEPKVISGSLDVLVRVGASLEAIQLGRRVLAQNPRDERALDAMARAYEAVGQREPAADIIERLQRLRPNDAELGQRLRKLKEKT